MYSAPVVYYVETSIKVTSSTPQIYIPTLVVGSETSSPMVEDVVFTPLHRCDKSIYNYGCSCIIGLKNLGYPVDRFNAADLQVSSQWGVKDDLVLFTYGTGIDKQHVACISQNMLGAHEIYECNKIKGVCGNRTIAKDDITIKGYISNRNFDGLCTPTQL